MNQQAGPHGITERNAHLAMRRVAARLKQKRLAVPMYSKEAAAICKVTPGHYSRIENGQVNHWTPDVIEGAAQIMNEEAFQVEAELNEAPPAAWESTYLEQVQLTREQSAKKTEELKEVLEEKMQCLADQLNADLQKNIKELQVNLVNDMEHQFRELMKEQAERSAKARSDINDSFDAGRKFFVDLFNQLRELKTEHDKSNQESKDYWTVIRMEQNEATAKLLTQMEEIVSRGEALNEIVKNQFS